MSSLDYLDLCRLCLVKDRVSMPIFEGEGDIRQIFLKITACLPVKVAREDKLPKKICDECVYKLELTYQFWHTTANAEKQLLQWLGEVNMEDKQGYVGNVLNPNGMKPDQNNENRLDGTVMQQVSEHQNNMTMGMMDNMGLTMPMMMSSSTQQQITSVPIDNSGSSVQNVQPVAGPSTQATHDQITQNQTNTSTQQEEEEESSEEDENSDDECDGDEGLPIKEESEEDPNNSRTIEPTTFVNVSLACDEAGPSGLQQQKIADMPEMVMSQTTDVDPKTGTLEVRVLTGRDTKIKKEDEPEKQNSARSKIDSDSIIEDPLNIKNEEEEAASEKKFLKVTCRKVQITRPDIGNTSINAERKEKRTMHECFTCGAQFNRRGDLKRHVVKHSDARPYKCTICERAFKRSSELVTHTQIHNGVTYTCEMCSFITTNKISLKTHVRRMHRRDFRYRCEQCDKRFMSNYDLEDHKASHLDAKTFICEYCGNAYSQKSHLVAHKRMIHRIRKTELKQHRCELCSKSFASEYSLCNHINLHSQRFLCAQCGKEFATNHALKLHTRIHTGERPYQCKICAKAFTRSAVLRVHSLTHTGERPYVCDLCGQSFTQRSSMMVHRRKHPGSHPPPPSLQLSKLDAQKSN